MKDLSTKIKNLEEMISNIEVKVEKLNAQKRVYELQLESLQKKMETEKDA